MFFSPVKRKNTMSTWKALPAGCMHGRHLVLVGLLMLLGFVYISKYWSFFRDTTPIYNSLQGVYRKSLSSASNTQTNHICNLSAMHKYTAEEITKYENNFSSIDDPGLVAFIQQRYLIYPSKAPSTRVGPERHYSQEGQSQCVDDILEKKENGFFIEAGALDGVFYSNSAFFERHRGWTGLLMEPEIDLFRKLMKERPGSYAINACLSTLNKTSKVKFIIKKVTGWSHISDDSSTGNMIQIQSFPLYSVLKAIGVDTVDYFSLDIEGPELEVLKTIPWDKIRINVITLEYRARPGTKNASNVSKMRMDMFMEYFNSLGIYDFYARITKLDLVFVRKDLRIKPLSNKDIDNKVIPF